MASKFLNHPIAQIVLIGILMAFLDACYLFFAKPFYENQVVTIQRVAMQVKPLGALAAYIAMAVGLWFFVLRNPTTNVYMEAMLLAFAVFGTYNATSYAILKKFRVSLALMDTVWGMLMFTAASYLFLQIKRVL
jgi:uncharacterized membrane protein